jgi:hypothetical protein
MNEVKIRNEIHRGWCLESITIWTLESIGCFCAEILDGVGTSALLVACILRSKPRNGTFLEGG